MTKRYLTLLLAVSALASLPGITGCGSSSSASEPLTKKEFLKKADLICEKASREQGTLAVRYMRRHPGSGARDYAEPAGIPPLEKQIRELEALGVPNEDKADLLAYFRQFNKDLAATKEEPLSMLSEKHNPFAQTIKLGRKYGFVDCRVLP
jgi:hypothetical protein